MQSFKTVDENIKPTPTSPRRTNPNLKVNTTAPYAETPKTPNKLHKNTGLGGAMGANSSGRNMRDEHTIGGRETFLDDITPVDRRTPRHDEQDSDSRHSHDLSLNPDTRNSLVDNMLLSLDQLSFGNDGIFNGGMSVDEARLYSSFADDDYRGYSSGRGTVRPAMHGHSLSSDYENRDGESRASSQYTRTRRSNSSSNFTTTNAKYGAIGTPRATKASHAHPGQKGSGGSAGSFDLGYTQAGTSMHWAQGVADARRRSASFDNIVNDAVLMNLARQQAKQAGFPAYNEYEAAPTPTVPVGPRRFRPHSPTGLETPKNHAASERKGSRSGSGAQTQKRAETSHGREVGGDRRLPALPAFKKEDHPSPVPVKKEVKPMPPPPAPQPQKRGFFSRVFGSKQAPAPEPQSASGSMTSSTERPNSNQNRERSKTSHGHPSPVLPPIPTQQGHTVKKSPSSFFRRRKKSISEPAPPPLPLPPSTLAIHDNFRGLDSPTNSLRQVMKPFLNSPTVDSTPRLLHDVPGRYISDSAESERDEVQGFSPGYTPDKSATIRSVDGPTKSSASRTLPRSFLSADNLKDPEEADLDRTFLQDSSDTERGGNRVVSQTLTVTRDISRDAPHSPASIARDMQMVQEYNEKYAKREKKPADLQLNQERTRSVDPETMKEIERVMSELEDEEIVRVEPIKSPPKEERLRLEPTRSEEIVASSPVARSPLERTGTVESTVSTPHIWYSATDLPSLNVEGANGSPKTDVHPPLPTHDENEKPKSNSEEEPTTGDRDRAKKIYDGNEDFIQKEKAAAWIGEDRPTQRRTLQAYMQLYDFKDMNILSGLRALCNRLILRAESQQVDRILVAFAQRWCACNPNHGFKHADVVHTICYSLLLLNTDLHMADIESKMTRSQFVKNTIPTILRVVADAGAEEVGSKRPSILGDKFQTPEPENMDDDGTLHASIGRKDSMDIDKPSWRLSLRPGQAAVNLSNLRANSDGPAPTPLKYNTTDDCGPLVKAPFHGTLRTWEVQVEIVLKDYYNAIKTERLPLFGSAPEQGMRMQQSHSTLSVFGAGMLRRTPSVISKAGSENTYSRGRTADTVRLNTGKWSTKGNRSRVRGSVYPSSMVGGSRTSFDDNASSIWSPGGSSSTWSKYSLAGKANTSLSVNTLGSNDAGDYQQSIGFANALSQAIIREEYPRAGSAGGAENQSIMSSDVNGAPLLDDESLELCGAPWAKEGILKHKHHLDSSTKRAKERSWNEVFAVIEKGYMSLFSFNNSSKSQRHKKPKVKGGVVGGGNWQDNAENLGSFQLRQTIASALPAPGYSKQRPFVFALSLPTGAVHLFQVGTETIIKEWVSAANYWSARLSNHPLVGGISNIEYGWSEAVISPQLLASLSEARSRSRSGTVDSATLPPSTSTSLNNAPPISSAMQSITNQSSSTGPGRGSISGARPSIQSSLRSSLDHATGGRPRLPADKITISEWTPPTQNLRRSELSEEEQLGVLEEYVRNCEEELDRHNGIRGGMGVAFSMRSVNGQKAMANWEKKSSYLLREIVKFRTYIDALQAAKVRREEVYKEREEREAMKEVESLRQG